MKCSRDVRVCFGIIVLAGLDVALAFDLMRLGHACCQKNDMENMENVWRV